MKNILLDKSRIQSLEVSNQYISIENRLRHIVHLMDGQSFNLEDNLTTRRIFSQINYGMITRQDLGRQVHNFNIKVQQNVISKITYLYGSF